MSARPGKGVRDDNITVEDNLEFWSKVSLVFENNLGSNYLVRNLIKDTFSAACVDLLHWLDDERLAVTVNTHRVGEDRIQWTVPKNGVRSGGNTLKLGAVVSKWRWQCGESLASCCVLCFAAYLLHFIR